MSTTNSGTDDNIFQDTDTSSSDTDDVQNTEHDDKGPWESLAPSPQTWLSKPIMFSDTEFITASDKTLELKNESQRGVLLYNTISDEWSMFFRYPDDVPLIIDYPTIHLDHDYHTLYVHSDGGTLLVIDTVTKRFEIRHIFQSGSYAHCITLHDKFHLLGGYDSNKHLIFEDMEMSLLMTPERAMSESVMSQIATNETWMNPTAFHEFTDFNVCEGAGFIHCPSRKKLFFFGGYDKMRDYLGENEMETYKIWCWEYETENGWTHYKDMKLPGHLRQFGFAVTENERYIIMSGGRNLITGLNGDTIYIVDLEEGVIRKSNVQCPADSVWHAIVVPKNPMDSVLINGYLRNSNFPLELIEMVEMLYSSEMMHLLKADGHYRISTRTLFELDTS